MHIIDLDKLDEYKNSSNKSFVLQGRQMEILEQISDNHEIIINSKKLKANSCSIVSEEAFDGITDMESQHLYPFNSLPYKFNDDYF